MRFSHLSDWLAWQETLHPTAIDLGLERVHRALERLNWRRPNCPVITVGGTNGKGSTVAFIRRMLSEAGYRVGTFTSPHLVRYNERITIAEREISDASLLVTFERIDAARAAETLTFFEFNALAALLAFETAGLDAIVLEVGMGGRLDAVNAIDADVAVICSVALDHCEWLGVDEESIGQEKAGILRPGRPAVFGAREMPCSVQQAAAELGCIVQHLGEDFEWEASANAWSWKGRRTSYAELPLPALRGEIQLDNASTALATLECVADRLPVTSGAIERALRTIQLPGRFQIIQRESVEWVLDVAHNPAAARTFAQHLASLTPACRTIAVCGVLGDKDLERICAEMRTSVGGWIAAGLDSPRALAPAALADRLRNAGVHVVAECEDVPSACARALELAEQAGRIVVFGSFLTVGPALSWLQPRCVTFA